MVLSCLCSASPGCYWTFLIGLVMTPMKVLAAVVSCQHNRKVLSEGPPSRAGGPDRHLTLWAWQIDLHVVTYLQVTVRLVDVPLPIAASLQLPS